MIDSKLLIKFSQSPGLCTKKELDDIEEYLTIYKEHQDLYKKAIGSDPLGYTLDSHLDKLKWYQDN